MPEAAPLEMEDTSQVMQIIWGYYGEGQVNLFASQHMTKCPDFLWQRSVPH